MNTPLQHPVFVEEGMPIHSCRLVDKTGIVGAIMLFWKARPDAEEDFVVLIGTFADDFLEHYRAAQDDEGRTLIMQHEIRKAAAR